MNTKPVTHIVILIVESIPVQLEAIGWKYQGVNNCRAILMITRNMIATTNAITFQSFLTRLPAQKSASSCGVGKLVSDIFPNDLKTHWITAKYEVWPPLDVHSQGVYSGGSRYVRCLRVVGWNDYCFLSVFEHRKKYNKANRRTSARSTGFSTRIKLTTYFNRKNCISMMAASTSKSVDEWR